MKAKKHKKRNRLNEKIKRLGKQVELKRISWHEYNRRVDRLVTDSLK